MLVQQQDRAGNPGEIDQSAARRQVCVDLLVRHGDRRLVGDIGRDRQHVGMTGRAQFGFDRGQALGVDVDQGDVPAGFSQDPRSDPSDTGRSAGQTATAVRRSGSCPVG